MVRTSTLSLFLEVGRIIRARMARALPLPPSQCETLHLVHRGTRPRMQDIAKHFHISAPSATALVDELVRHGYLSRVPGTRDRRQIEIALTPKGLHMVEDIDARRTDVLNTLLASLTAHDHADLDRILTKIITRSNEQL